MDRVKAGGLSLSMTERDHCAENALAERMNGILKSEYGLGGNTPAWAAHLAVVIGTVHLYNTRRPHTALIVVHLKRACAGGLRAGSKSRRAK